MQVRETWFLALCLVACGGASTNTSDDAGADGAIVEVDLAGQAQDLSIIPDLEPDLNQGAGDLAGPDLSEPADLLAPDDLTPPDTTPPKVLRTTPKNTTPNVGVLTSLQVVFSEPMNKALTSVVLKQTSNSAVVTTVSGPVWSNSDATMTYQLTSPLAASTGYTFTVAGQDLAGNLLPTSSYTFTTGLSIDPPTVDTQTPPKDALEVAFSTPFSIHFDRAMDTSQVPVITIAPTPSTPCPSYAWQGAQTLACTANLGLANQQLYVVTVPTAGTFSSVHTQMTTPLSYQFTSALAPAQQSSTPLNNALHIDLQTPITVTFNKAVTNLNMVVTGPTNLTGTLVAGISSLTWSPALPYKDSTAIQWTVTGTDFDSPANAFTASGTFTTSKLSTITLTTAGATEAVTNGSTNLYLAPSFLQVGHDSSGNIVRTYLSFDLSQLPANVQSIYTGTLGLVQSQATSGSPGTPRLDSVYIAGGFGVLQSDLAAISLVPPTSFVQSGTSGGQPLWSVDVSAALHDDWKNRAGHGSVAQFELTAANGTSGQNMYFFNGFNATQTSWLPSITLKATTSN